MKVKVKFYLVVFAIVAFGGSKVFAQEEGQSSTEAQELNRHAELNVNDDKSSIMDVETKTTKAQLSTHEVNAPVNAVRAKSDSQNKSAEKTEDPLSFNFLYLIIQKFKISDIVDD